MSRFTIEARWETPASAAAPRVIGQLYWQPVVDGRVPGIEAPWCRGKFKILTVTRSLFGLFFESNECCQFLKLGSIEHLKSVAISHKCDFRSPKDTSK